MWIFIHTVVFQTHSDGPPCSVCHKFKYMRHKSGESLFNSSAQLTIIAIVVHSNLYLDNASQSVSSVARSEMHDGLENGVGDVREPRPIQQPRNYSFIMSHTLRAKCAVIHHASSHTASMSAPSLSCGIKRTSDISM